MNKFICIIIVSILFVSCSEKLYTNSGAIPNATFSTSQYDIKEIEITKQGSSIMGIPVKPESSNVSGIIFTFNGVRINKIPQIAPILSMIGYTFASAEIMRQLGVGKKDERTYTGGGYPYGSTYSYTVDLGTKLNGLSFLVGLPVAATMNSLTWRRISSLSSAGSQINTELISKNPEVDMLLFPKYEIETDYRWLSESSIVNLKVKGAILDRD
ncbi:MAG: hypothetical protein CMP65_01905 [Flavobacteriales bacterium]|nr:hypothetical protein [Flavobacteriales bacterium]|tara:strand:- start:7115 stop:7753 length:639 start_codon:yes stop_codon:yes gene_type:complete